MSVQPALPAPRHATQVGAAPRDRLGGIRGNEALTVTTAVLLTVLLLAEGVTVIHMGGLRSAHMFIGLALIPPLVLKLASVGYRFARYYLGSAAYRAKGPPRAILRALAPLLVLTTAGIFVTGVLLMVAGHKSSLLLEAHKVSFIVWSGMFGIHFLAYLPHVLRSLPEAWTDARRPGGAGIRALLATAAAGGGAALAIALLPTVRAWHP